MMAYLYSFREGWQSEHLAKFIISKFSFVAEPSKVSDDLGSDFFCTLFKIFEIEGKKFLSPQNSFAIQIKSNKDKIDVTNKTHYLNNLQIPFFVGVVNRSELKLEIYSGESICHFFTYYGNPTEKRNPHYKENNKILIELLDSIRDRRKLYENTENEFILKFFKILELDAKFDYQKSENELTELFEVCGVIQKNISSMKSNSYIYDVPKNGLIIYAGPGSAKTFRDNFFKRLAEVFYNLYVIYDQTGKIDPNEFEAYKNTYLKLLELYGKLPTYLTSRFSDLDKLIEKKSKKQNEV